MCTKGLWIKNQESRINNKERIRAEILYKERKREKALNDKCLRVAARYEREINALLKELENL